MIANNHETPSYAATQNACKLCMPLGACLAFKGIRNAVPVLHGSQGCATYIRRYLISHFREPVDIACSNFAEETTIFGGGANLKTALDNIRRQYAPELAAVATTCLSETIGDDISMFINEYRKTDDKAASFPIVPVSTPSYQATHLEGFHAAVRAATVHLASANPVRGHHVNLFPGMLSPADLRYLKEAFADFGLPCMMLPDYSQTLDGGPWSEYHRIVPGGTPVKAVQGSSGAMASIGFGKVAATEAFSAAMFLEKQFQVPCQQMGTPIGVKRSDAFFKALETLSGRSVPERHQDERSRLIDALVDGHKYVNGLKAVIFGDEDMVDALADFLAEIGIEPVLCATGAEGRKAPSSVAGRGADGDRIQMVHNADFVRIESVAASAKPDLLIGNSKGYAMSRRLDIPLIRVGFPIHDRFAGPRLMHVGYRGAQQLFDRIVNAVIERRQALSPVGYAYM